MRARLYHLLRRVVTQERRNWMKRRIAHYRARLAPIYRVRYGTFTAQELATEIAGRLPENTEIVMVHCSINDLQPMYDGTVPELLDELIELCGSNRTLVMPAFFFGGEDGDAEAYYREHPRFSARRTPSQMGILSELFRRRDAVRRSLHPTASISALGPHAEELVRRHHEVGTNFGAGTPFAVMAERQTAIVGIGVEYFRCLSQVHAAEDLLGDRYPLALRPTTIPVELTDLAGSVYSYDLPVNARGIARRMELLDLLLDPEELVRWRFHGVPLFVVSAGAVTQALIEAALNGETIYDPMPISRRRVRTAA